MGRRALMGVYVKASTANPTGWRPWNSRLSFYVPNSFPLPTAGRGPWLLQPGAPCARPAAAGGLGVDFPNYAGFGGPRDWVSRVQSWVPSPVYGPPPSARMRLSGLGVANLHQLRQGGSILPTPAPISAGGSGAQTNWRTAQAGSGRGRRGQWGQQNQNSNYEGWSANQQPQSYQQWQQQQAQTGSLSSSSAGAIVGYDASGNPIYSSPPAGLTVTGTDAQGNPIYGAAGSASSPAAGATSTPSSSSSILTEDSLGLGLPNIAYAGIALGLVLILKKR